MKLFPFLLAIFAASSINAATYYIDDALGNDSADGKTPQTAWKSLNKVNFAPLAPGDTVRFKRGGLWRGQLNPKCGMPGTPVTYTNYGDGPLPIIQGSVDTSDPAFWTEYAPGIWQTVPPKQETFKPFNNQEMRKQPWSHHIENGAKASLENIKDKDGFITARLTVSNSGTAPHHLQLWGPEFDRMPSALTIKMRIRANRELQFRDFLIQYAGRPYTLYSTFSLPTSLTSEWQEFTMLFLRNTPSEITGSSLKIHTSVGGVFKSGDILEWQVLSIEEGISNNTFPLPIDVGTIIFDHGQKPCGWKKWKLSQLVNNGDFLYMNQQVFLKYPANPATLNKSIEMPLRCNIINEHGCHDIIYDGLAVRYGASHGFGGGDTENITIRNCDIYYIGGGHQYTHPNGYPVRYGNGIEFWGTCNHNLVENNRIWEIYDAALTNQGREDSETNVTYRNNVIWNAEYSFEYWNAKVTDNIVFENNTCVDAGFCWSHRHRPNPNGAHMMFYNNPAKTTHFIIRNNIFFNSTEVALRQFNRWLPESPIFENNLWGCSNGTRLVRFEKHKETINGELTEIPFKGITMENFNDFQTLFPNAKGNFTAIPKFVNPEKRDYRLAPDSPGFGKNIGAYQKAN